MAGGDVGEAWSCLARVAADGGWRRWEGLELSRSGGGRWRVETLGGFDVVTGERGRWGAEALGRIRARLHGYEHHGGDSYAPAREHGQPLADSSPPAHRWRTLTRHMTVLPTRSMAPPAPGADLISRPRPEPLSDRHGAAHPRWALSACVSRTDSSEDGPLPRGRQRASGPPWTSACKCPPWTSACTAPPLDVSVHGAPRGRQRASGPPWTSACTAPIMPGDARC